MLRNRFGRQCSRSNPLQKDHVFNAHFGSFVSLFMIWRVFISAKCMNISWNPIVSMWTLTLVCMRFSVYNGDCNFLIRVQYGLKLFELKYLFYHRANACGRGKKAFLSNFYVILSFAASSNGLQICWQCFSLVMGDFCPICMTCMKFYPYWPPFPPVINYCESDPCQNGGACQLMQNMYGYTCECPIGYGGINCETRKLNT